jgi:hypothetical protein
VAIVGIPPNTFSGLAPSVIALLRPWRWGCSSPVGPLAAMTMRSTALNAPSSPPSVTSRRPGP